MDDATSRAIAASCTLLAYVALCLAILLRERRRHAAIARAGTALAGDGTQPPTLVLFASQTGQAEAIAWQTARDLHADGTPARVLPLNELDAQTLRSTERALFIASTYGEGDAPDGASLFAETVMTATERLPMLRYAMLALGDSQYAKFCGFGRGLDAWLQSAGATPTFARIDVDNGDPVALDAWRLRWGGREGGSANDAGSSGNAGNAGLAGHFDTAAMPAETSFSPWRLVARSLLNAGSEGAPVYQLGFRPSAGTEMDWQSGDLIQIALADDPARPRDYSIASITADGEIQLLVRQERHADGTLGAASGLLTATLAPGDSASLRLKPHRNFRLGGNAERPLILIGNGTGLAGLRSHLRARAALGRHDNWLVFGERRAAHDFLCRDELESWQATGVLQRLDMVFSRDVAPGQGYVQHRLLQNADEVQAWIARGAAVYVCGSLKGMASGVDAALRQIAGDERMRELIAEGRYRRDVY